MNTPNTPPCPFEPLDPLQKDLPHAERQSVSFAQFYVEGMGCDGCQSKIYNSLMALPGIVSVEVDRTRQNVEVVYNPVQITPPAMAAAIAGASGDGPQRYRARWLGQ